MRRIRKDSEVEFSLNSALREQAVRRQYAALRIVQREDLARELGEIYVGLFKTLSLRILNDKVLTAYGFSADEDDLTADQLPDLNELAGGQEVFAYRDYAIDGETPSQDLVYSLEDVSSFVALVLALGYHTDVVLPVLSLRVFDTAVARFKLDSGTKFPWLRSVFHRNELYLSEIALLAGMSERSVRNATLATANDRLTTHSESNRVLVTPVDALRWLRGRKAFVETKGGDYS